MRILILTTSYPQDPDDPSGAFIHSLALALARRGHLPRVLVPGRTDALGTSRVGGIEVRRFRYAPTAAAHRVTSVPGGIPEALRRYRTAMLEAAAMTSCFAAEALAAAGWADVIYANWLGAGLAGAAAHLLTGKPVVLTLRGDDAYLIHDRPLWRAVGRWVFARCRAVTAVSENMIPLVAPQVPRAIRPVLVPTFGVDIERFRPAETRPAAGQGPPAGLFVGNVSRAKGVDVLLQALAQSPGAWRAFRFVGGGPDLPEMRELAASLGIAEQIDWLGPRPVTDVPDLMRQADYLVLPSLSEGRPNVVVEAMATGLAVIATTVGAVPDLIDHGRTGLWVAPGDTGQLAEAIRRLGADPDLVRRLGRNARAFVEREDLTWDRTAREFEAIFHTAIK